MSCLATHQKQAMNENPMYCAQKLLPSSSGCRTFFIVACKIAASRHCRKKAETLTAWIMLKLTMLTHSELVKRPHTHDLHTMLCVPFSGEHHKLYNCVEELTEACTQLCPMHQNPCKAEEMNGTLILTASLLFLCTGTKEPNICQNEDKEFALDLLLGCLRDNNTCFHITEVHLHWPCCFVWIERDNVLQFLYNPK